MMSPKEKSNIVGPKDRNIEWWEVEVFLKDIFICFERERVRA